MDRYCANCGKLLKRGQKKFCSNSCQCEKKYKDYIERWKQGKEDGIVAKYETSDYIRKYLHEKYNNSCARCGWHEKNPFSNRIPLEIEHIDGNYKNNKEENLILLCPNCHSLTSTYKGLNRGKGRKGREKYYRDWDRDLRHISLKKKHKCPICGKETMNKICCSLECSKKYRKLEDVSNKGAKRISKGELEKELKKVADSETSFVALGSKYGVSDNAIRKWCKFYDLPFKKKDIKAKFL